MGGILRRISVLVVLYGVLVLVPAGCFRRAYFDSSTIEKYGLTDHDLMSIQYFTTTPFILEHENVSTDSRITRSNRVQNEQEKYTNLIVSREETPGRAIQVGAEEIVIDVAHGLHLGFRPAPSDPARRFFLDSINGQPVKHNGTIMYRGRMFKVLFGEYLGGSRFKKTERPQLMYDLRSVLKHRKEVEEVKGSEPATKVRRS